MSSWTERMASVVAACGPRQPHPGLPYRRRLEKVKFGVSLDQVCKRDIPGPLLVMLLKLNKEGPFKKDVFRAPGHQGNMKKLIHFLQQGRLVNIHSFSVNTIASVLKKFLRKLPGGIFGPENEAKLFSVIKTGSEQEKLAVMQKIFTSLPIYSQHLLVLLFGTFRVIHSNSERAKTGMTAEALGVSVAPSFFHTCVSEGKIARPEEVNKFKLATKITSFFIEHFGMRDLFGRENYEYYARLTGRILKVEDEWIFFTYPPMTFGARRNDVGDPMTEVDERSIRGGGGGSDVARMHRRDSDPSADPSVVAAGAPALVEKTGSLEIIPESCPLDPNGRLSISLDDHNVSSPSSCGSHHHHHKAHVHDFRTQTGSRDEPTQTQAMTSGDGSSGNSASRDAKPYTCLPQWIYFRRHSSACTSTNWDCTDWEDCQDSSCYGGDSGIDEHYNAAVVVGLGAHLIPNEQCQATPNVVHQRQTERMRHRSEWFLSDPTGLVTVKCRPDRPLSLGTHQISPVLIHPSPVSSGNTLPPPRSSPLLSSRSPRAISPMPNATPVTSSPFFSPFARFREPPPPRSPHLSSPFATISSTEPTSLAVCDMSSSAAMVAASLQSSTQQKSLLPYTANAAESPVNYVLPICHQTPNFASTMIPSTVTSTSGGNGSNVRLRRRLSDKDKERRLVRRSSSKRKDKENGGKISTSSSSLDRHGSSGALGPTASPSLGAASSTSPMAVAATAESGPSSLETALPTKPRNAQLKRAGSADAGGGVTSAPPTVRSCGGDHPMLCRTGSQDNPPQVEPPALLNRSGSKNGSSSSLLTRSLPRI